ncbi:hypothetical protein GCM10010301_03490 [Streptomyces plicatus]|nr:hypothetical protein GCM10010301_03490 [Streptomyces plicatus]
MWHADARDIPYEGLWWKPPLGPVRIPPHGPARFLSAPGDGGRGDPGEEDGEEGGEEDGA